MSVDINVLRTWNIFIEQTGCIALSTTLQFLLPARSLGWFYQYCCYLVRDLRGATEFCSDSQIFEGLILLTLLILLINLVKGDRNFSCHVKELASLVVFLASKPCWKANMESSISIELPSPWILVQFEGWAWEDWRVKTFTFHSEGVSVIRKLGWSQRQKVTVMQIKADSHMKNTHQGSWVNRGSEKSCYRLVGNPIKCTWQEKFI